MFQIEIKLKQTFQTIVPNNYGKNTMVTRALDFMQSEVGQHRDEFVPVSVRSRDSDIKIIVINNHDNIWKAVTSL